MLIVTSFGGAITVGFIRQGRVPIFKVKIIIALFPSSTDKFHRWNRWLFIFNPFGVDTSLFFFTLKG